MYATYHIGFLCRFSCHIRIYGKPDSGDFCDRKSKPNSGIFPDIFGFFFPGEEICKVIFSSGESLVAQNYNIIKKTPNLIWFFYGI